VPDPASLTELGLAGLFIAAFLAGSILPFSSEVVLVGVLALGTSTGSAVAVATVGNVVGALTLYGMGRLAAVRRRGERTLTNRVLFRLTSEDPARLSRASKRIEKWGPVALLAAWVPFVGDALVLTAGLLALPLAPVTVYVTVGKAARYLALAAGLVAGVG
jgi:membrane protein YqaA with SNARE-associated domain